MLLGGGQSFQTTKWQAIWHFSENSTNQEILYVDEELLRDIKGICNSHLKCLIYAFTEYRAMDVDILKCMRFTTCHGF